MYMAMKHTHLLLIGLSVVLFIVRFGLMLADSPLRQNKVMKIAPHAIDTVLLISGLGLIMVTGFMPFTEGGAWLTNKITCVLAYIALGVFAFRGSNRLLQVFAFLGALGWVVMAFNIATTKSATLFG